MIADDRFIRQMKKALTLKHVELKNWTKQRPSKIQMKNQNQENPHLTLVLGLVEMMMKVTGSRQATSQQKVVMNNGFYLY